MICYCAIITDWLSVQVMLWNNSDQCGSTIIGVKQLVYFMYCAHLKV